MQKRKLLFVILLLILSGEHLHAQSGKSQWVEGAQAVDVYLDPSTYQCLGDLGLLRISDTRNTLLRFDLAGIASGMAFTQATLRLYVFVEYQRHLRPCWMGRTAI